MRWQGSMGLGVVAALLSCGARGGNVASSSAAPPPAAPPASSSETAAVPAAAVALPETGEDGCPVPFEFRCAGRPAGAQGYSLCGSDYEQALVVLQRFMKHGACIDSDPVEKYAEQGWYVPAVRARCGSLRVLRLRGFFGGQDAYFDEAGVLVTLDDFTDAYAKCPTVPRLLTAWYRMGPPHHCIWTDVESLCPTKDIRRRTSQ